MAKLKLNIVLSVLMTLLSVTSAYSLIHIPLLEGTIYNAQSNQPVRSGHVEILDFNVNPPVMLYAGTISSSGTYSLVNLTFPDLDGIRIMAYPSDISWDKGFHDGGSTPLPPGNNPGSNGPVSLQEAQIVNNTYILDIFVDWIELAKTFELQQNYPNPFNPKTVISFGIPVATNVTLKVYDMSGQEVATLFNNEFLSEGLRRVEFDGSNLASGVYFYSIITNEFSDIKKMILVK
jgi:hypothetical protein